MGNKMWYQRMRGTNEPGGFPDGYICDFIQSERDLPARRFLEVAQEDEEEAKKYLRAMADGAGGMLAVLENSIWFGFYMSGGIGFSNTVGAGALAGNIIESFSDELVELVHRYTMGARKVPPKWETVRFMVDTMIQYTMESYEKFPTLAEFHWGGAHRISIIGALAGSVGGILTGSSTIALMAAHYAIAHVMKEGWLRTGWAGQEVQDHIGLPYLCSFRPEEGNLGELRGANYPMQSYTAAHVAIRGNGVYAAMLGRGSAWCVSPVVKVAFADPHLIFDFKHPKLCIAKAGIKQFMPAGERDPVLPPH
jgi:methyl-coenzyme M reductase alpha subunit